MLFHQWKGGKQTKEENDRYESPPADSKTISTGGTSHYHHHHNNTGDTTQREYSADKVFEFLDIALLAIAGGHACSGCHRVVRYGEEEGEDEDDSVRLLDGHEATPALSIVENLESLEQERDESAHIPELLTGDSFQSIEDDNISAVSSETLDLMDVQRNFFCLDLDCCDE